MTEWIKPLINLLKRWRKPFALAAVLLFGAGLVWSVLQLDITPADLQWRPLAILFLFFGPLALFFFAVGLQLSARAVNCKLAFWHCFRYATFANLAEALPVPGGAIVRGGALIAAGVTIATSAWIIGVAALLWVSLAAVAAAAVPVFFETTAGTWLVIAGVISAAGCLVSIAMRAGLRHALYLLLHRLTGIVIILFRISTAFAVLGVDITPLKAAPFAFAVVLGSVASIAPAGLGISEALAAMVGATVDINPATAFMAIALNSISGLAATAVIAAIIGLQR